MSNTPLDAAVEALISAGAFNPAAQAAPEAVLWCDAPGEFAPIMPLLRDRLPQLLTFGHIDPTTRTGPAVWLRAAAVRALPAVTWDVKSPPIIYFPGVARESLRDAENCPQLLLPLAWLGVSGAWFGHVNGKDWTLRGFLAAERGSLNLEVADDPATREALGEAAAVLFGRPIADLRGRRWDADTLHALLAPDLAADTLDWMCGKLDSTRFKSFAARASRELGFDPRKLSPQDAARRLARREGEWDRVWSRFESLNGRSYETVIELLRLEEPAGLFDHGDAYPAINQRQEDELRRALSELGGLSRDAALIRLVKLEQEHAPRRDTVWGRRGEAALAVALGNLAVIAKAPGWPAHDAQTFGAAYAQTGARVDRAALAALAAAPAETDRAAVSAALRAVYLPWLEDGAVALQSLVKGVAVTFAADPRQIDSDAVVFVDGLRMDLAISLVEALEKAGAVAQLDWRWTGFPTSTATCKPLVSPVARRLHGMTDTTDLTPVTGEGRTADHAMLRKLMANEGWGFADDAQHLWLEIGTFDDDGHKLGARLADQISQGIANCANTILALARAGRRVRVVTDHGWLLIPGGLTKAALDTALVELDGKRTRSARIKPGAQTTYEFAPWSWNPEVRIAYATGAMSFFAACEYAHGGISPQECITPVIDVAPLGAVRSVSIVKANWENLRLRVEASGAADLRADLRLGAETSGPSLLKDIRVLDEAGCASMLLSDIHEGKEATLVILDDDGRALAARTLIVGGG